jgi:UDP-N-acetylglucosamine acyltransferase
VTGTTIHPTAVVTAGAELGEGCEIGPYAIVEEGVTLGAGTRLDAHAMVRSGTVLGEGNVVHPFAVLGGDPQDRRYAGEPTRLVIGDRNVFREHVTVHRGTAHGGSVTRIGSGGLFMASVHVGHDAQVGDAVIFANGTLLAGHVAVGDHVVTGGQAAIAPFVRVGDRAFLAAGAMVERDVPPFVIASGDRARVRALNKVGLGRTGVPPASIAALEKAFVAIFRKGVPRAIAAAELHEHADPFVRMLVEAIERTAAAPAC